jgi:hypothetical protein
MKTQGLIIAFLLIAGSCAGQQDTALKNKADRLMAAADFLSAIPIYKQYIEKGLKDPAHHLELFEVYDSAFTAALLVNKYTDAEKFVIEPFEFARKLDLTSEVYNRLTKIPEFYKYAQQNNWPVTHPVPGRKIRELIFQVTSVKYLSKDTAILNISGGSIEGLKTGVEVQGLGVKNSFKSVDRSGNVLGRGKITKVTDNTTSVLFIQSYTTDSSDNIYPGDVVICDANSSFDGDL